MKNKETKTLNIFINSKLETVQLYRKNGRLQCTYIVKNQKIIDHIKMSDWTKEEIENKVKKSGDSIFFWHS
jgi:hypothetical protein